MKTSCCIFLLIIFYLISFGQQGDSKKIAFNQNEKQFELIQDESGAKQFLIVKKNDGEITKTIELEEEFDPYRFADSYPEKTSFFIISGRYKFYILNTITEKVIGPVSCTPRGEFLDAQSGMWYALKSINNGEYLLAYAIDLGLYCYDLHDLNDPKEVEYFKTDSIHSLKRNYIFIDLRKDNIYNLISASCGNFEKEIIAELLLVGYKFRQDSAKELDYKITDNRYLVLRHVKSESIVEDLSIDLNTGTLKDKLKGSN